MIHVTAPQHWLNDPTGPLFWQGRYHLFFQYNPHAPEWDRPHWGHVSSSDLVSWRRHPVALEPTADGHDRDGCWSGSARVDDGVPTIHYTGVVGDDDDTRVESVLRATSTSADLDVWHKDAVPRIPGPPAAADTGFHRDPFVFVAGGRRYLILGSSVRTAEGLRGAVLVYTSEADDAWRYRGVLVDGQRTPDLAKGRQWECPQFVALADQDLLIVSVIEPTDRTLPRRPAAITGALRGTRFDVTSAQQVDRGDLLYAPTVLVEPHRVLMWAWIQDPSPVFGPGDDARRVGALSLPREVHVREGRVAFTLPREIDRLRQRTVHSARGVDISTTPYVIADVPTHAEIACTFRAAEGTVRLDLGTRWDGTALAVDIGLPHGDAAAGDDGASWVRLFFDRDIVEVYASGHTPHTTRLQPGTDRRVSLQVFAGSVELPEIELFLLAVPDTTP